MKKALRNIIIGATCMTMLFAFTGCNKTDDDDDNIELISSDTETRPVAIAIGALDENFNPFFYTSGNDGEVISMTQISMLTADAEGHIVCGDDQATMARDYSITSYTSATESADTVASGSGTIDHTTYKFVIKNGVKDSQGYDMSVLDVLFNLYVYLDPLYSGSSTIYSTKIQGLAAYRSQQEDADDDFDYESEYRVDAQLRYDAILDYDVTNVSANSVDGVRDDLILLYNTFADSLKSDWNSVAGTLSSSSAEYRFTEDWEKFLFEEGLVTYQYRYNEKNNLEKYKDEKGRYYTTLEEKQDGAIGYIDNTNLVTDMQEELEGLTGTDRSEKMQEAAIQLVLDKYFLQRSDDDGVYYIRNGTGNVTELLTQWSVGGDFMTELIRDEMSQNAPSSEDGLTVKDISGITVEQNVTSFDGVMGVDLEGEEHDVLVIRINGVDPAAIYNFAFTVAPMHYYSSPELVEFAKLNWSDRSQSNRFGVKWQNKDFMDEVVAANNMPVGAGAYKIMPRSNKVYDGSMVSYERNENFTTLGSGIENAKIKYLNYVYTTDDQIINSLTKGEIDYGQPNCTRDNVSAITGVKNLNMRTYDANGFGYVGINPTYVPNRAVRVAIMLAMNPQMYVINNYYTSTYSSPIYRPTSTTNFLNTNDESGSLTSSYIFKNGDDYQLIKGKTLKFSDATTIKNLVLSAGYKVGSDGKLVDENTGEKITLAFTIAGETEDHPAYQMFDKAAELLNGIGFDITVMKDSKALAKLATGKLAVWAAAWSTGIDPDLYQIYHKDSKASSTKNWGYETIMNNSAKFSVENALLTHLSSEIDNARSITAEKYRTEYYVSALNDIMELAIELPTYQRKDLGVYNRQILKASSLNQNPSANAGLLYKVWELDYN